MRILVYEFVIGGGCSERALSQDSLLVEGRAMLTALVEDFSRIPGVQVEVCVDRRIASEIASLTSMPNVTGHWIDAQHDHWSTIDRLCDQCDAVLVVAPEFHGVLEHVTRRASGRHAALLSPSVETVALFSHKQRTANWLGERGIPIPWGREIICMNDVLNDQVFPAIVKPIDGAGSQDVRLIHGLDEISSLDFTNDKTYRLETFCPGMHASVAILCHGGFRRVLPPCHQRLVTNTFEYRGGQVMADGPFYDRATRLGDRVASVLPDDRGYIGVDLVLGDNSTGVDDYVIEVNPRMTTSYVGLRAATDANLAEVLLNPSKVSDLRFLRRPLEFQSDGTLLDLNDEVISQCDG